MDNTNQKLSFRDIISLASNGYKPSDIKELLNLSIPNDMPASDEVEQKTEDKKPLQDETEDVKETQADIDYKSEIEALKAENEKIKAQLATAQRDNISREVNGSSLDEQTQKDLESINDWARSFM